MSGMSEEEFEYALTQSMDLARIIETFLLELVAGDFVQACHCCNFPTPTPFFDFDRQELLCRECRTMHNEEGEHVE